MKAIMKRQHTPLVLDTTVLAMKQKYGRSDVSGHKHKAASSTVLAIHMIIYLFDLAFYARLFKNNLILSSILSKNGAKTV